MQPLSLTHTPLTAAEMLVLQDPNAEAASLQAFKLTLMEMIAHRLVTIETVEKKGIFGRTSTTQTFHVAPDAATRIGNLPHYRVMLDTLSLGGSGGAPMESLSAWAKSKLGGNLANFRSRYVIPALIQRGVLEEYKTKVLFVFTQTRYRLTNTGEAVKRSLDEQLAQAQTLPGLLDTDPTQAAILALSLGSVLFLADDLRPHFSRLSGAMRQQSAGDDGGDASGAGADAPEFDTDATSNALSSFEGGLDSLDFSAFDTLDSSFDALDAGFDSAFDAGDDSGGDSGGDGGGGSE